MKSLMKRKPLYSKRRLVVVFLLCLLFTVTIFTGFSTGGPGDNTVYTPQGRIVMWADVPEGATPENCDLISSLKYTAQNIYNATYFRGETHGSCVADVFGGIKYNQNVDNTRVVYGDVMFQEAVSISTAKKSANQRYIEGDNILYRPYVSIKNNTPVYSDQVEHWTIDEYYQRYGAFPKELSKYVITPITVLSATDNNAIVKAAANSDGNDEAVIDDETNEADPDKIDYTFTDPNEGELTCNIPEKLVKGADGNYTFTLRLDEKKSSMFYRNEVKSLGDADKMPVFYFVELKITITEDFYPVSITTTESYDVTIPVLGALRVTGVFTETFTHINEPGEVPEQDFFRSKFDDTPIGPIEVPKSPSDYLAGAFAPYINGESNLDLGVNLTIGGVKINNLLVSADLKTYNVNAKLGNMSIAYTGDRVYLSLNDVKGYVSVENAAKLISDPTIASLISSVTMPDFNAFIGDDILDVVLRDCEITQENGLTRINLPFTLTDSNTSVVINADIYVIEGKDKDGQDTMMLDSIVADVSLNGIAVSVNAEPRKVVFDKIDDSYKCLDGIFEYLTSALDIALNNTAYSVTGNVSVNGVQIGIDGYIDRTDGIAALMEISAYGVSPVIKYAGNTVYVELGNIKLKANVADFGTLTAVVSELTGIDVNTVTIPDALKDFLPSTVADYINIIQSLDLTENGIEIGLRYARMPVKITLEKGDGELGIGVVFNSKITGTDIVADFNADLHIAGAKPQAIDTDGSYVDVTDLLPAIQPIKDVVKAKKVSATLAVDADGLKLTADVQADFTDGLKARIALNNADYPVAITIIDTAAYIELRTDKYDIGVAGTLDDIPALLALLDGYIPENISNMIYGILDGSALGELNLDVNEILGYVTSLTCDGDVLYATVSYNDVAVNVSANTNLSSIVVSAVVDGMPITATIDGITTTAEIYAPNGEFISVNEFVSLAAPVLPLIGAKGYALNVNAEILGIGIDGDIQISLDNGLKAHAALFIGDVTLDIYFADGTVYASLDNTVAVKVGTTKEEMKAILAKLMEALPEVDFEPIIETVEIMYNPAALLDAHVSAYPTDSGFAIRANLVPAGLNAVITLGFDTANGLSGITVSSVAFDKEFNLNADITTADGALVGVTLSDVAALEIVSTETQNIAVPQIEYTDVISFIDLIKPILGLVNEFKTAKSLNLDISADVLDENNNLLFDLSGYVKVSLTGKLAIDARIELFASETDSEYLYIRYAEGVMYLRTGDVMLSLDTDTDLIRLYTILDEYLPDYIMHELGKLLGVTDGYLPEGLSELTDGINRVLEAKGTDGIISALLSKVRGENGNSVLKTFLSAVKIVERNGKLNIDLDVMNLPIVLVPDFANDTLQGIEVRTNIGKTSVAVRAGLELSENEFTVAAPDNADSYVSIMEFVDAINSAVNIFKSIDEDGNISFAVKDFAFNYDIFQVQTAIDENGNEYNVKDSAGRDTPAVDETGEKLVSQHVEVTNKPGEYALKANFVKSDNGYRFNLEAHVKLDIKSLTNSNPLTIDLYVINNDEHPNGLVFLDYLEGNGYGERIYMDYKSIMQLVAAVMDILAVDEDTVETLLGSYRQPIDTTVFKSMDIAGLDSVRDLLNGLVDAIQQGTEAISDVTSAWDLVASAGSINGLLERTEQIGNLANGAIDKIKPIIAMFSKDEEPESEKETAEANEQKSVAELYKMVVNGISFVCGTADGKRYLSANIDNQVTTQTDGEAYVTVTQTENADGVSVLDSIGVGDLDVNTAKLNKFNMTFTVGEPADINVPDNYTADVDGKNYKYPATDFSNVKQLLFDVMNTANMLEFEISDSANTDSGKINLNIALGIIDVVNFDIRYNAKVAIVDQGEGADPRYKTAALIELVYENCKALGAQVVADCTTRLFFYDNVFYIQGKHLWAEGSGLFAKAHSEDVYVVYTLDELISTVSGENGMEKLMDEFLFYLLPLSVKFTFMGVNLQDQIKSSIVGDGSDAPAQNNPMLTIAQVFKQYQYNDGEHTLIIGLKELANSSQLSDLTVKIKGMNDDTEDGSDANLLDNYVYSLNISTTLASVVTLTVDGKLTNTEIYTDTDGVNKLRSSGLRPANIDGKQYSIMQVFDAFIPTVNWNAKWRNA